MTFQKWRPSQGRRQSRTRESVMF